MYVFVTHIHSHIESSSLFLLTILKFCALSKKSIGYLKRWSSQNSYLCVWFIVLIPLCYFLKV